MAEDVDVIFFRIVPWWHTLMELVFFALRSQLHLRWLGSYVGEANANASSGKWKVFHSIFIYVGVVHTCKILAFAYAFAFASYVWTRLKDEAKRWVTPFDLIVTTPPQYMSSVCAFGLVNPDYLHSLNFSLIWVISGEKWKWCWWKLFSAKATSVAVVLFGRLFQGNCAFKLATCLFPACLKAVKILFLTASPFLQ